MFSGACTKSFLFARHFFHLKLSKNYNATCVGLSGIHNAPPIAVSLHLIFPLLPRRRTSQDEEHEELPNQHGRSENCCAAVTLVPRPLICCDQTVSRDVSVPISLLQAVHDNSAVFENVAGACESNLHADFSCRKRSGKSELFSVHEQNTAETSQRKSQVMDN